jgi:mRNA-degrading endonuclease RelE of RelBE toxin-antitoxin system
MSANERPTFQIRLRSRRVERELDSLQEVDYQRVSAKLKALASDPRPQNCEKLSDDIYRIRVGNIRIIYRIDSAMRRIDIGGIRRRSKNTYKGIDELFG